MGIAKLKPLAIVLVLAVVALLAAVGILRRDDFEAAQLPTPTLTADAVPSPTQLPSPTTIPPEDIVATVNGEPISRMEWETAAKIDAALNELSGFPPPSAESTLDGLVNERLILAQSDVVPNAISDTDAENRLQALLKTRNIDENTLSQTLVNTGVSYDDLLARVKRLMVMESTINRVPDKTDHATWLAQLRANAEIGLYQPLAVSQVANIATSQPKTATPTLPGVEEGSTCSTCGKKATATPTAPAPTPDLPVAPLPGNRAPMFALNRLDGESVSLEDLRGKPTIINFWATWCPPCRQELPVLENTFKTYREQINFVAVNLRESSGTVQPFADKMGLTFPILLDTDSAVSQLYQVRGIPTTLFLNANGVVVNRHVGPLDKQTIEGYLLPLLTDEN